MKVVTFEVGGSREVVFGRFFLFYESSNMCTNLFPNPFGQVHNRHLVLRKEGKKKPPTQIGHHM